MYFFIYGQKKGTLLVRTLHFYQNFVSSEVISLFDCGTSCDPLNGCWVLYIRHVPLKKNDNPTYDLNEVLNKFWHPTTLKSDFVSFITN